MTIAARLKFLNNFWRLLEMPLLKSNLKLKLKWAKCWVWSAASNENINVNDDDNNSIFTIKETKLYFFVATFFPKANKTLWKLFNKGFESSAYWNEYEK